LINPRTLPTDLWRQLRYYGYGIFVNEPHPFHVSHEHKLNVLQTLSYVGVMFGLMPLVILSGWAFLLTTLKAMLTGWHRGCGDEPSG
jgi:thiosulfate reductase cytochrome b subunit